MIDAFWFLTTCSFKNWFRVRLRRLREPRYLIGLAVGLLYLWGTVFRSFAGAPHTTRPIGVSLGYGVGLLRFIGAMFMFVMASLAWLLPGSRRGMVFTPSEVQFLFTAPVTRRQIVHYKLLRAQTGLLFGSAIATLLLRPQSLASSWMVLVGVWIMLTTGSLYMNGVALRRLSLSQHGRSGWRHEWLPLAMVVGAVGVIAFTIARDWPALAATATFTGALTEVDRLTNLWPMRVVLWPFMALVRVPTSASLREFLTSLPFAVALAAIAYVWAIRSDAAFEEASAELSEKVARRLAAPRGGRAKVGPTPFTLGLAGRPELAILWKNLIMPGRYFSIRTMLRLAPLVLIAIVAVHNRPHTAIGEVVGYGSWILAGYTVLIGPQIARNDLRQDLAFLPVLKTWPMTGTAILRGEILAPAAILTAMLWLFLLVGMAMTGADFGGSLGWSDRVAYTVAALVLTPGITLAQLAVQNAIAVIWPGWVAIGVSRARGIDVMGQRLLMVAAMFLTLVVALVPAGVVGGGVAALVYWLTGRFIVVIPAFLAAAVMIGEVVITIQLLGKVFDRTDPASLDAAD